MSRKTLRSVSLTHGEDVYVKGAEVTTDNGAPPLDLHAKLILRQLWYQLGQHESHLELLQDVTRSDTPLDLWDPLSLSINGVMVRSFHQKMGAIDVVLAESNERGVSVISAGLSLDKIKLINADLSRYT